MLYAYLTLISHSNRSFFYLAFSSSLTTLSLLFPQRGVAAIPHIEFWRQVPGYVSDGCSFSRRWLEGSYRRGAPLAFSEVCTSSGGYEPIQSAGAGSSFRVSTSRSHTAAALAADDAALAAEDEADYARALDAVPASAHAHSQPYDPISPA